MSITELEKNLPDLRNAVAEALVTVEKKFNVTFMLGRTITFGDGLLQAKGELLILANKEEMAAWNDQNLVPLGLKKEWFGRTFVASGRGLKSHRYTVTGLNPEDKKFSVQAVLVGDIKKYGFAAKAVRESFEQLGV
jgi:hypothetical protein